MARAVADPRRAARPHLQDEIVGCQRIQAFQPDPLLGLAGFGPIGIRAASGNRSNWNSWLWPYGRIAGDTTVKKQSDLPTEFVTKFLTPLHSTSARKGRDPYRLGHVLEHDKFVSRPRGRLRPGTSPRLGGGRLAEG